MLKRDDLIQLYHQTCKRISSSQDKWKDFLNAVSHNYKLRFDEQVLVYAQRPDATAVLEMACWNNKFKRWVKKGSEAINVLSLEQNTIVRYFDITDTVETDISSPVPIWKYDTSYNDAVITALKNSYNTEENKLEKAVLFSAKKLVTNTAYSDFISSSAAYIALARMGLAPQIEIMDFESLTAFRENNDIVAIGAEIRTIAVQLLSNVKRTINIERNTNYGTKQSTTDLRNERGNITALQNERENGVDLQVGRRLLLSGGIGSGRGRRNERGSGNGSGNGRTVDKLYRQEPQRLAVGEQPRASSRNAVGRNVAEASVRSADTRTGDGRDDSEEISSTRRNNGRNEEKKSDALGRDDEQLSSRSDGNNNERVGSRLDLTSEEQQNLIASTAEEKPLPISISQEDIDALITKGSGVHLGKYRIYSHFKKQLGSESNIAFLKNEYGIGGSFPALTGDRKIDESHDAKGIRISLGSITNPSDTLLLPWSNVEKRIRQLINADRYLSATEKEEYPKYLETVNIQAARNETAKELRSILKEYNEFQESVGAKEKCLNVWQVSTAISSLSAGEAKTYLFTTKGDYVLPIIRKALNTIISENTHLTDRCEKALAVLNSDTYSVLNGPEEAVIDRDNMEYKYAVGDKLYINISVYQILEIEGTTVCLCDEQFPLMFQYMSVDELNSTLKENPLNDKYLSPKTIEVPKEEVPVIPTQKRNYKITDDAIGAGTPNQRYENNINAIRLLKKLDTEKRNATPDEQEVLAKYVGWGGLSECFNENNPRCAELKNLLSAEEFTSAKASTLTSFYTPPVVIKEMYRALANMGFTKGNILEPSCGVGNFIGLLPTEMKDSKVYGVELDDISGHIAKQLYQKSSIAVQGFEKTDLPDSFFDVVIGNVPFGQFKVVDKKYDKHNFLIHDYFFAKALDKVRPGGVVALITSKGTMDKTTPNVRKYIAERADLLGAIRLPNNTFKGAAGTEVTSDIIFLKKKDVLSVSEPEWIYTTKDENGMPVNQYFVDNPDMVLGEMRIVSGPYGATYTCEQKKGEELSVLLRQAVEKIKANINQVVDENTLDVPTDTNVIAALPDVKNFSYAVVDGKIYFRENSIMTHEVLNKTAEQRVRGLIQIRDSVRKLIELQTEDYSDSDIKTEQENLNKLYDAFVDKYGYINSRANTIAFCRDASMPLLTSLESFDSEGNFECKADMFYKRTIKQHVEVTSVGTATEALILSVSEKTIIDMEYMSLLTGKTEEELYEALKGIIFLNPMYEYNSREKKYLTADEYLSGNVREKLKQAIKTAELYPDDYTVNVQALEKVQPKDLSAGEITVRLGATWLPVDVVQQFVYETLKTPLWAQRRISVKYVDYTGEWTIEGKNADGGNIRAQNTYGSKRANAYKIIEDTLNLRDVRIYDYVDDGNGKTRAVLNKTETQIAQAKQQAIKDAFADWIWHDIDRRERLVKLYNEKFNSLRPREYDGSHLNFYGMNNEIELRKHQVDAVARIIYGGNTLLGHVVGAGKTFEIIAAAQESKRLGLCNKSLIVVPNHLTEQWASEYMQLYPSANILVATKKDFETKRRKQFCSRIATGDFDAVIIGHTQFEKIPLSVQRQRAMLKSQIDEIVQGIEAVKHQSGSSFTVKQYEQAKKSVENKLEKLNDQSRKDDVITFEELGIDRLFVDEAHYYKNLAAFTKMRNVGGIAQIEAQKSSDLFMKCRYLDEITEGRGIVFATGTPISNTMVEMYTMQRYLQHGALKQNNLLNFDAWASTFGETITAIELAPEGTGYRIKTRFSKFHNLPELMSMFKMVADIQTSDMLNLPVPKANYHTVSLEPSQLQKEMVAALAERAEKVRNRMVSTDVDNMLLITNDGRKLALDQRLVNAMLPASDTSKVSACADNVYRIWQNTVENKSTQLVFCDLSTPNGKGYNVYDDLKNQLVAKGIPVEEIAFIHSANTEAQKATLFDKVRSGDVRILIGSTPKMGAGTNVQERLIALHHLDCPWRPADLQQREGRIIRQGNNNAEVDIFTYITKETFDAYLYQLVESKQRFIGQIMTSKSAARSADDIDEQALSYAEIKALCTGNPLIKEKMDLDVEVARLKVLRSSYFSQLYSLQDSIAKDMPAQIRATEQRIQGYTKDIEHLITIKADDFATMIIEGVTYSDKKAAGSALLAACAAMKNAEPKNIGEYKGFGLVLEFDSITKEYKLILKRELRYSVVLGNDIFGNIQRIDNALKGVPEQLKQAQQHLASIREQLEEAKGMVNKPWEHEEAYKEKTKRLAELNVLLDESKKGVGVAESNEQVMDERLELSEDGKTILKYRDDGSSTFVVPQGITAIGARCFAQNPSLETVVIPDSVKSIGDAAFLGCSIVSVSIGNGVKSFGNSAFFNCNKLKTVTLPDGVEAIPDNMFFGCAELNNVKLPNSVRVIGDYSFAYCKSLRELTLPNDLMKIGNRAFEGVPSASTTQTLEDSIDISINSYKYDAEKSAKGINHSH